MGFIFSMAKLVSAKMKIVLHDDENDRQVYYNGKEECHVGDDDDGGECNDNVGDEDGDDICHDDDNDDGDDDGGHIGDDYDGGDKCDDKERVQCTVIKCE